MLEDKNGPVLMSAYLTENDLFLMSLIPFGSGICAILLGIWITYKDIVTVGFGIVVIIGGIYITVWGWLFLTDSQAYYDFSAEGVDVKYLFEKHKIIPWDDFQEVCVCYTSYTTRGKRYAHSVICFVKHGEKYNFYGRWKADDPMHSRSVISIEYTDELYEEIQKQCPYKIPDLRKTRRYRL